MSLDHLMTVFLLMDGAGMTTVGLKPRRCRVVLFFGLP